MPLARIVTKLTEESQPLQEQLRARGFDVETASPDQFHARPADLEITLEEMTPAQALARADAIADAENLAVYITPGSISESSRPITVIPIVPQPEEIPAVTEIHPAQESDEERQFDPVAFEKEEYWTPPSRDEVPEFTGAAAQVEASPVQFEQAAAETVEQPVYMEQVEEPAPAPVAESTLAEEAVPLAPEIQEIVPELEAVMPDMEAWAREEGPVSDWPIWQAGAMDPTDLIRAVPVIEMPSPAPVQELQTVRKIRRNPFASDRVFWKTAAWAAMVALSALVLGATVHRFSPVPARFANTAQPADPKPAPSNTPVVTPVAIKPSATLKRTSAREEQVTRPEASRHTVVSRKPQTRKHRSSGDSVVAEDTVVRYRAKPPAPKVQAQMKSDGIKRYTDLK